MKFLSLLGMAQAAGRLISGDTACYESLLQGRIRLIVLASDAADRTRRHFVDAAKRLGVPYVVVASKAELGKAIGKPDRAVIGVADTNFARSLQAVVPVSGN